jgi:DNA mismatch repair protein MutS2
VIPLRAEFKGRIPGLVHDQSSSGATVFIEPLATVELNNQWRELQLQEEREVKRILHELSALVSESAEVISRSVEILAGLDLAFAKARYSQTLRGVEPTLLSLDESDGKTRGEAPRAISPAGIKPAATTLDETPVERATSMPAGVCVWLRQARHPLLPAETVVPANQRAVVPLGTVRRLDGSNPADRRR